MVPNKNEFLSYIKRFHKGKIRAIYCMELARIFNCKETEIRSVIHELRSKNHEPILSDVQFGYWFASSRNEAGEYIRCQKSRLHEQNESLSGVIKGLDKYFEVNLFDQGDL